MNTFMQNHRLAQNTISSLILQVITLICGFILPRMILQCYGSEINGLVNSITQFLSVIAFLELGVGAVVQSSLYKPLAYADYGKQSEIYVSAQRFFRKLAGILLLYIFILMGIYSFISKWSFGFAYVSVLIGAMSISSLAQYYFGIVNSLLLTADQKGYIQYNVQIITLIANTICCVILMARGKSIHFVKLITSLVYLIRPLYLNYYVKRYYKINKKIFYSGEPIAQKWNGISQHIAAIVLDGTDIIILTLFAGFRDVSVYSVYYLVISSVKQMFYISTNGVQALLGDLYARGDKEKLNKIFRLTEWVLHTSTTLIMGCVACLITPFVLVYTKDINDANYNQIVFGYILTLAYTAYCLRLPYHMMVKASGKYRETQKNYIISAIFNLILSIIFVNKWGLIGVAIGTFIAMLFQAIWLAIYNSKHIMHGLSNTLLKRFIIDAVIMILGMICSSVISLECMNFWDWTLAAIKIMVIWIVITIFINLLLYKNDIQQIIAIIKKYS